MVILAECMALLDLLGGLCAKACKTNDENIMIALYKGLCSQFSPKKYRGHRF